MENLSLLTYASMMNDEYGEFLSALTVLYTRARDFGTNELRRVLRSELEENLAHCKDAFEVRTIEVTETFPRRILVDKETGIEV